MIIKFSRNNDFNIPIPDHGQLVTLVAGKQNRVLFAGRRKAKCLR